MTQKFKYNRFIILFRILLIIIYSLFSFNYLYTIVSNGYYIDISSNITLFLLLFLLFSIRRLIRLIFQESLDIYISDEGILVKNIITRKQYLIKKNEVKGCRMEKFTWNFYKVWGIKSFFEFNSNMIVFYSNFTALVTLKSFNYFSFNKIWLHLLDCDYSFLYRHQKMNTIFKYSLKK